MITPHRKESLSFHEKEGVYTGGTVEDFMNEWCAELNPMSGRVPFYCSGCDVADFPHWEMGRTTDDSFDRRNEVTAPPPEA